MRRLKSTAITNPEFGPLVTLGLSLMGCSGSVDSESSIDVSNPNNNMAQVSLNGSVYDGPVSQSDIFVNTRDGTTIWIGSSDDKADYSATMLTRSADYPLTIRATGGIDLVTNVSPDIELRSMALDPTDSVGNINLFSTIIHATVSAQSDGLNSSAVQSATNVVLEQLNFGLDIARLSDPITTPIQNSNVATLVRSSEAFAEMIRRTQAALYASNVVLSADDVITHLGGDLTDGFIDGLGSGADARVAATSSIISAQVLIETMTNELRVGGVDAQASIDAAIAMVRPDTNMFTGDLTVPHELIMQTGVVATAAFALSPSEELGHLLDSLYDMPAGASASTAKKLLPPFASTYFGEAISKVATGTDGDFDLVNESVRMSMGPDSVDYSPPIISLIGPDIISLAIDEPYVELSATATDNRDGDISSFILIDDSGINAANVGNYFVTYNVSDSAGNAAEETIRTVNVTDPGSPDTFPPVITLNGDNPQTLIQGDTYIELGATAMDNVDGEITARIVIDNSSLIAATVGTYSVTYDVSDSAGNAASQKSRIVTIEPDDRDPGHRPWEALLNEATGFARNVIGGAGGQLITVTNLNDSGPGSLREALAVSGRTWIRFTPGLTGTVSLNGHLSPGENTTIDGRGSDITIERPNDDGGDGAVFYVSDTNNLIFAYLKVGPARLDCLRFFNDVNGVWLHHLSLQGAGDELLDINRRIDNVTVSWSHFFNSNYAVLTDGGNNADIISNYTFHHNYFDGVNERTPRLRSSLAHVYNNYTRAWLWSSTTSAEYAQLYWENNIADALGANNKRAAFSDESVSESAMGKVRSAGSHQLLNGAFVVEKDSQNVFDPRSFYPYTPDPANNTLRNAIVAGAGWQDVPFAE